MSIGKIYSHPRRILIDNIDPFRAAVIVVVVDDERMG